LGSLRWLARADTLASDAPARSVAAYEPLGRPPRTGGTGQALIGGTWTNEAQLSLLAEAWWTATASVRRAVDDWRRAKPRACALVGTPAPTSAVAGNLAVAGERVPPRRPTCDRPTCSHA